MKKKLAVVLALTLALSTVVLGGCGASKTDKTIKIGAGITPHAEILEQVKGTLEKEGYTLEIVEYSDYVLPNTALDSGELDANYFQHQPYLDDFNKENGTNIVSVASIHFEPFGIYAGKTASLDDLADGATVAVPNDTTNEARALLLLEDAGLIQLKKGVGVAATIKDIVKNPKNLEIIELEAAQLPRSLADLDLAVINGNFALDTGLSVEKDALLLEKADSVGATKYQNLIAVRKGDQNTEKIKALIEVLTSKDLKDYINQSFEKAVVAK